MIASLFVPFPITYQSTTYCTSVLVLNMQGQIPRNSKRREASQTATVMHAAVSSGSMVRCTTMIHPNPMDDFFPLLFSHATETRAPIEDRSVPSITSLHPAHHLQGLGWRGLWGSEYGVHCGLPNRSRASVGSYCESCLWHLFLSILNGLRRFEGLV